MWEIVYSLFLPKNNSKILKIKMFVCLKTETMGSENNSDNNGSRHNPYEWRAAASLYKIFMFYFFLNTPFLCISNYSKAIALLDKSIGFHN